VLECRTAPGRVDTPLSVGIRGDLGCGPVPRLNQRAARALGHVRLIVDDASSPAQLAQRALDAIHPAVPFDLGAVWLVDPESLLLTGLLARRGHTRAELDDWVRDIYLVAGEPPSMQFPALLRHGGGVAAYHSDPERWLRVTPEPDTARGLAMAWRATRTPSGGFLRYGLAHRRRWVGALQLARLDAGSGFRSSELEYLDRAAPALGRALAERLAPAGSGPPRPAPDHGRLIFDHQRRVVSVSPAGLEWLGQLDGLDDRSDLPIAAPLAAQSLVSHLAASGSSESRIATTDVDGRPVIIHGERLLHAGTTQSAEPMLGYCLTVCAAPPLGVDSHSTLTDGQWRVARAVAQGLTDRQIAAQLGVAPATVHERVQSLHNLLDTHSRAQLVATLHLAEYRPWPPDTSTDHEVGRGREGGRSG
jgi:DNA-binding CsgD family transcriptional regulator